MSLISRFMTGEYSVVRSSKGAYVKGRYVPGPIKKIKVCGSMQPKSARELKLPEEGDRLRQYWAFYTDAPILTDNMATLASGDRVIINGDSYRAMSPLQWQNTNLDYFMTILWREPEQSTDGTGSL